MGNQLIIKIDIIDGNLIKDDLFELRSKALLRGDLIPRTCGDFWYSLQKAYPLLAKRAMIHTLCQSGFSTLVFLSIQTKKTHPI